MSSRSQVTGAEPLGNYGTVQRTNENPAFNPFSMFDMRFLKKKRLLRWFAILTLAVIAGVVTASWIVGGRLVAACPREVGQPPSDLNATAVRLEIREIELQSSSSQTVSSQTVSGQTVSGQTVSSQTVSGQTVSGQTVSGQTVSGWSCRVEASRGVVILLHGIRGSRLDMVDRSRMLQRHGYSTILIDLQAHGESSGEIITLGYREKFGVKAAVQFAKNQYPGQKIAVIGCSLGGASALLAGPLDIDALVIEAVFPTINQAIENRVAANLGILSGIPSWLLKVQLEMRLGISRDQLCPIEKIDQVDCPVFIISGSEDRHTTVVETEQLFARAHQPKQLWIVDEAAHVDLFGHAPDLYEVNVLNFLDQYVKRFD
ncbi:MAG: alpha/beta hydrolase [Pirellulales bacterium]